MQLPTALGACLAIVAIGLFTGCAKEQNSDASGSGSQSESVATSYASTSIEAGQLSFVAASNKISGTAVKEFRQIICSNPAIIPSNSLLKGTLAKITPNYTQNQKNWLRPQAGVWLLKEMQQFLLNAETSSSVHMRTKVQFNKDFQPHLEKAEIICNGIYDKEDLIFDAGAAALISSFDGNYSQIIESQHHFFGDTNTHKQLLRTKLGSVIRRSDFVFARQMRNHELYPGVFYSAETYIRSANLIEIHAQVVWRELSLQQGIIYRFEWQAMPATNQIP